MTYDPKAAEIPEVGYTPEAVQGLCELSEGDVRKMLAFARDTIQGCRMREEPPHTITLEDVVHRVQRGRLVLSDTDPGAWRLVPPGD
ncbi:MAG: hypothetical protein V1735_04315 [Nanoarchaeota archaeon]